jgi:hypothetical protein
MIAISTGNLTMSYETTVIGLDLKDEKIPSRILS